MFPRPVTPATRRCDRCHQRVRVDRLVAGRFGEDCAQKLGLTGSTIDTGQTGPDLFDSLEEDYCDGYDR